MAFNNKDLKKINALIAIKHTMSAEAYINELEKLRHEIISDIVVNSEIEQGEKEILNTVHKIIKPSVN